MTSSYLAAAAERAADVGALSTSFVGALSTSFVGTFEANVRALADCRLYTWLNEDLSEATSLTYAEMRQRVVALCCVLRLEWSVGDGERVALVYPPGLDLLVAFFGCAYSRAVAVPFYPPAVPASPLPSDAALRVLADGLEKLRRVVASCEPSLFLSTRWYLRAQLFSAAIARRPECAWPPAWRWQASDEVSSRLSAEHATWFAQWLPQRLAPAAPDELAFLQYTSGSTGSPKGVKVSTCNLLANIAAMKGASECSQRGRPGDAIALVSWLPQYHDMGLVGGCLAPALLGWRADLLSPPTFLRRPAVWLAAISRLHASHDVISPAPNFGFALCARRVKESELLGLRLSHWRMAMTGAEPIRPATLRAFDERFAPCGWQPSAWACVYGLAESTLYAAGHAETPGLAQLDRRHLGLGEHAILSPAAQLAAGGASVLACAGCVLPSDEFEGRVTIVEPATRAELPAGRVGEVWLSGPSVALGYWGCCDSAGAEETFGAVLPSRPHERQLRTGDLGLLHEGRLHIVGRLKDVLERLALMLELKPEAPTTDTALSALVGGVRATVTALQGVKPWAVQLLRAHTLPKTTSGKLRRQASRELFSRLEAGSDDVISDALLHGWSAGNGNDGLEVEGGDGDDGSGAVLSPGDPLPQVASATSAAPEAAVAAIAATQHGRASLDEVAVRGEELVTPEHALSVASVCEAIRKITFAPVDPDEPLDELGLDSTDLFELEADLRERTGLRRLRVFELLQHQTLRALVVSLQQEASVRSGNESC